MSNGFSRNRLRRRGGNHFFPIVCLWFVLITWGAGQSLYAAEDDYLSLIEMETEKVETRGLAPASDATVKERPSVAKKSGSTGAGELSSNLSIEEFGQQLDSRLTGSAVFYRKLSRRDQEAIYQQYLDGAPVVEVRKKIMDRFLKR